MIRSAFVLVLVLAGCTRAPEKVSDAPAPAVPEFSPKNGLSLPEQTQQSLGLSVVDVEERAVSPSFLLSLRVYETDGRRARASGRVTSEQADMLHPDQVAVASTKDGTACTGTVIRVDKTLQEVGGATEVLVEFPNRPEALVAGAFVDARVMLGPGSRATAIPVSALLSCSEGKFVYAVNGTCFVRTPVSVGKIDDEYVEITDGLYEGDQVVAQPVLSLWMTELASVKGGQSCCAVSPEEN